MLRHSKHTSNQWVIATRVTAIGKALSEGNPQSATHRQATSEPKPRPPLKQHCWLTKHLRTHQQPRLTPQNKKYISSRPCRSRSGTREQKPLVLVAIRIPIKSWHPKPRKQIPTNRALPSETGMTRNVGPANTSRCFLCTVRFPDFVFSSRLGSSRFCGPSVSRLHC